MVLLMTSDGKVSSDPELVFGLFWAEDHQHHTVLQ